MNYGHLKVADNFRVLDVQLASRVDTKLLQEALSVLSKFLMVIFMKVATTKIVNFFTIGIVGYYTIYALIN